MNRGFSALLVVAVCGGLMLPNGAAAAGLGDRVNEAFRAAFGRQPLPAENSYWVGRVQRGEKTTFTDLLGAMYYEKAHGSSKQIGTVLGVKTTTAAKKDDKQTLTVDTLPEFVKIYKRDPSNAEKAWWRKRIACDEIKTRAALQKSMGFHKAKNVGKGSDAICGAKAGSAQASAGPSGTTRRAVAGISNHPMGDQVRIGIYSTDGRAIHVTSDGKYQIREGGSKILTTVGKEDVVQVSWSGGKYHVRGSGHSFDTEQEIRLVPLNQAIMEISSYSDKSATIAGKNYNRFRGIIEIRMSDDKKVLWAINELRTEYYLRGLAETSGTGPEEYLKALAVAARTYVLYHKVVTGGRSVNGGWDINNTADDQLYRGYEYEIITPRMASVFNQVKGVIATDGEGDKPVTTVYFSDSDGRTRSAKEVWKTDRFPHLQHSVDDPHHASSTCKGHCVGMSAQGAYGFANKDGWSFQKILNYYFKGIKLVKAY
ncbi:MAG TPA: SpoIID/LytB domain-containing protein [Candidatus Andersenbacteria bacterium]|nr:SpoIID/LytB domain-containing protein [Candidatus Andersenbacteria bacterium]